MILLSMVEKIRGRHMIRDEEIDLLRNTKLVEDLLGRRNLHLRITKRSAASGRKSRYRRSFMTTVNAISSFLEHRCIEKERKMRKKGSEPRKMGSTSSLSSPKMAVGRGCMMRECSAASSLVVVHQFWGLRPCLRRKQVSQSLGRASLNTSASRGTSKLMAIKARHHSTNSAPKREKDPKKRIVVTGMGLVSAFGDDVDMFYEKLLEGESAVSLIDRFDTSSLPVRFAGQIHGFSSEGYIDPKVDDHLDDSWRYCLVAGSKALEDANLGREALQELDKSRIGVLVGSGTGGAETFRSAVEALATEGFKKISPLFIPFFINNTGSALLAIEAGLMGPCYSISAACATSNFCICAAANHIRRGEAEIMVAGGVEAPINPMGIGSFFACRALSQRNDEPQKASRPWDTDRDGFVLGEGSAVLILESLDHAIKRGANIVAEYLGGAITCDAHHVTDPRSDGLGVSSCILKSLQDAGVSPEEVNYVNAHATSTLAGDLAEINALKRVFRDTSEMKMNATKSIIGHGLGAAGGLEAIATIKAITTGWLHPTINQHNLEPEVSINTVPNTKQYHEVHVGISNSFGFGGQNSVVVFAPFLP